MTIVNRCTINYILSVLKESQQQLQWYKRREEAGVWNRPSIINEIQWDIEHHTFFVDLWMQHQGASIITVQSKTEVYVQ